ncbi:MAG: acetylglutamate kinase [Gemmatimonadota bacterium]|jgi:acetylglutamate kinase|nr:acetylglutamate kinase [Gemmatimonadota bacterium]
MGKITVVKVGGNEVDDPAWVKRLASGIAASPDPVVVVHGGGKEVSDVQRTLGAEPAWRDGLRVTTPEALRAVSMVLSGLVNKRLVAALITAGVPAAGLSGEDGGTLRAVPVRGGVMGRTGEIERVDGALIRVLLDGGFTPVISPVSRGPDGGALNVNADDSAAAVAGALGAERFLLVSNVPGVLRDGARIPSVTEAALEELISLEVASGGMIPKLRAGMRAAAAGVADVRIGDLSLLSDSNAGTRLLTV